MERGDADWRRLALAFFALAHGEARDFYALEAALQETEVGRLCAEYLRTGEAGLLERAGYLLTGTEEWSVYLGRMM